MLFIIQSPQDTPEERWDHLPEHHCWDPMEPEHSLIVTDLLYSLNVWHMGSCRICPQFCSRYQGTTKQSFYSGTQVPKHMHIYPFQQTFCQYRNGLNIIQSSHTRAILSVRDDKKNTHQILPCAPWQLFSKQSPYQLPFSHPTTGTSGNPMLTWLFPIPQPVPAHVLLTGIPFLLESFFAEKCSVGLVINK